MYKHLDYVQDTAGNAIAGATVYVYTLGTSTAATIYSTKTGTTKTNPMTSAADGSYWFFAPNNLYDIVVTKSGYTFDATETAGTAVGMVLVDSSGAAWSLDVDTSGNLTQTAL